MGANPLRYTKPIVQKVGIIMNMNDASVKLNSAVYQIIDIADEIGMPKTDIKKLLAIAEKMNGKMFTYYNKIERERYWNERKANMYRDVKND